MTPHDHKDQPAPHQTEAGAHTDPSSVPGSEQARRDAIRKIGKYSAYVAPAMLAMFSQQAHAS